MKKISCYMTIALMVLIFGTTAYASTVTVESDIAASSGWFIFSVPVSGMALMAPSGSFYRFDGANWVSCGYTPQTLGAGVYGYIPSGGLNGITLKGLIDNPSSSPLMKFQVDRKALIALSLNTLENLLPAETPTMVYYYGYLGFMTALTVDALYTMYNNITYNESGGRFRYKVIAMALPGVKDQGLPRTVLSSAEAVGNGSLITDKQIFVLVMEKTIAQ